MKTTFTFRRKPARGKVISCSGDVLHQVSHKDMMEYAKELSQDPKAARGFLQRAGIITRAGKVAKAYGG